MFRLSANYIIFRSVAMNSLSTALNSADEAYLTALSNKGLYKRALRELPGAGVTLRWEGDSLTADFADGTRVTVAGSIREYRCTCPSRSVCKHLLMAILRFQEQGGGEGEPPAADAPPPDFSPIAGVTAAGLEKLAGKKALREVLLRMELETGEAAVEEGSVLRVVLPDSGHTVRFLPGAPLAEANCSCKSPHFCAHRTEAVLRYIKKVRGALPAELLPQAREESPLEFSGYALPHIRRYLAEVFSTGLARLPEDTPHRFEQLATICHSRRLANMERLCSRAAGQLTRFFAKSATFRPDALLGDLSALVSLCGALESGETSREAVGVFRERYRPIPTAELHGLGAYQWHSPGGYTGVSALFFCPGMGEVLTYTTALPATVSPKPEAEKMYHGAAPWKLPAKLSAIAHSVLLLTGGKVSGKNQLSSSETASAQSRGPSSPDSESLAPIRFGDFSALLESLWKRGEEEGTRTLCAILTPARYGACRYDEVDQRLTLPVYDSAERRLTLEVAYEPSTALLLQNLRRLEEGDALRGPLLARVSFAGGALSAFPITAYEADTPNLGLDRLKTRSDGKTAGPYFDWGDAT